MEPSAALTKIAAAKGPSIAAAGKWAA